MADGEQLQRELETIADAIFKALRSVAAASPVKLDARLTAAVGWQVESYR